MAAIGGKAVTAVESALKSVTTNAVSAGMSFESTMSSVAALSGATGSDFDKLSDKAKQLGASTKYTSSQIASAMEYMSMAGWKVDEMLSGMDGVINLTIASGGDLARTSDIVTDALTAFGKQAKDSGEFADVLATASANANTNVDLMGETFKYVGSVAGAMGYSIQDIALATSIMANSSIKGSAAGTALRATITRMAKPTEESSMAMSALGLSLTDANGNMNSFAQIMKDMRKGMQGLTEDEKASYATMLGGQEAMSGLLAIVNASDEDFNKLSDAINNASGAAETMASIKADNLKGAVDELKSGIEGIGITAFEQAKGKLKEFVKNITSEISDANKKLADGKYIEKAIQWVEKLGSAFKNGGLEGGLKEIGGLLDGTGEKVKALGAVLGTLGVVTKASDFFQSNTWKLVSTGIGGINKTLKETPQWAKNAGKSLGNAFNNSKLGGILQSAVGKIKNPFKDILDGANGIQKIGVLGGKVVQTVTSTVQTVGKLIFGVGSKMFSGLTQIMGLAMKALMPAALIAVVLAGLGLLYQTFGSQIDSILQLAQTQGPQFITNLVNGMASRLPDLIQQGGHLVSELLNTITANLPALITGGVTLVQSLVSGLISALPELIPSAVSMVTTLITGIASALPQLIMTGMRLLLALTQGITENLPSLIDAAIQSLSSFAQGILQNLPAILMTAAQIIGTLAQGIIGAIPQLLEALPQVLSAMIDTIMATDWLEVGKQVVLAIGEGIFGGLSKFGGKIGKFFGDISDWCAGGEKGGKSVTSGAASGINAGSSQVSSAANALGNTAALVREIMRETGIPLERVYRHYDICSKNCPSQIIAKGDWTRFKKLISGGSSESSGNNTSGEEIYKPGVYKVNDTELNIRIAPNANSKIVGVIRDQGSYTITKIQNGSWGKLLSGAGWINCHTKYCTYGGTSSVQKPAAKAISVDGVWGPELTRRLQEIFGTGVDGKISNQPTTNKKYCVGITAAEWSNHLSGGSALIKAIQKWSGVTADGYIGPQTIRAMQRKLGTQVDGVISNPSAMVRALQEWCNRQ